MRNAAYNAVNISETTIRSSELLTVADSLTAGNIKLEVNVTIPFPQVFWLSITAWSRIFHPCSLVPIIAVPHFPPPVIWCRYFQSCIFHPCIFDGADNSSLAFSPTPSLGPDVVKFSTRTLNAGTAGKPPLIIKHNLSSYPLQSEARPGIL